MNIFVTDPSPLKSAQCLPDKHVVKMPLESCQMLSIICSKKWGHGYGQLHRTNGKPYKTDKGAFRNHPCTIWAMEHRLNTWWLLRHAIALCNEYTHRYGKVHSCEKTVLEAAAIIPPYYKKVDGEPATTSMLQFIFEESGIINPHLPKSFTRAMPDEYKHDTSIDTFTAYKNYIRSKPWAASNYLRDPSRQPDWIRM